MGAAEPTGPDTVHAGTPALSSLPAALRGRLVALPGELAAWLSACWRRDAGRRVLWLPVAAGLGCAIYFALPAEPAPLATFGLGTTLLAWLARALWRTSGTARALLAFAVALLAGFLLALARAHLVAAPVLPRTGVYALEGRIELVEPQGSRLRLTLADLRIRGLSPERTPARVRVSLRRSDPPPRPGDGLRARARLAPPLPPACPDCYDFARDAWFRRLGAVGWVVGRAEILPGRDPPGWSAAVDRLRLSVAERARARIGGTEGAVAAALLTGLRGGIDDATWEAMQRSGLAHLLAISGLHLGLVATTAWLLVRWLLAAFPAIALRVSVRRIAALAALAAAAFYVLLAGAPVPTRRAFVMVALALLAVLAGRSPLSMRLVALAALFVLALQPESVTGASFQMSFAAVVALVAVFENVAAGRPPGGEGLPALAARHLRTALLTTVVAGFATLPFAAWHFGRIATFGVLANLLAVPLTALWIVPAGFLALALVPLGLDGPAFDLMGAGIGLLLDVARAVAALPAASLDIPPPPTAALLLFVLGGLWLALWQASWRRLGLLPLAAGLVLTFSADAPLLLVAEGGRAVAVHAGDRALLWEERRDGLRRAQWQRALAVRGFDPFPARGAAGPLHCDPAGCAIRTEAGTIALPRAPAALAVDCARAVLVITGLRGAACPDGTARVLDGEALERLGGIALRVRDDGLLIESVAERRGRRPWTR